MPPYRSSRASLALALAVTLTAAAGCTTQAEHATPDAPRATESAPSGRTAADEAIARQRDALTSRINDLEQRKQLAVNRLTGLQAQVSSYEMQVISLRQERIAFDARVQAYLMDHKLVLACLGALGVSLDSKNAYAENVKDIATAGSVVCAILMFDEAFRKEAFGVVDALMQADHAVKSLGSRTADAERQAQDARAAAEAEQGNVDALARQIETLRGERDRLG